MGLMNFMFGGSGTSGGANRIPWIQLSNDEELDALLQNSHDKPAVIFKHSSRCGVSSIMHSRLESEWDLDPGQVDMYFLDLIAHRELSHAVARRLDIRHESPQMIVLRNGEVLDHTSHSGISIGLLKAHL